MHNFGYESLKEVASPQGPGRYVGTGSLSGSSVSPGRAPMRGPQNLSYRLSDTELKELYNPRGHMPKISFSQPNFIASEATRRVDALDAELQERVQGICDRLCSSEGQSASARCISSFRQWCGKHITLGVVKDIVPNVVFYVLYSFAVSYYAEQNDWEVLWTATKQDAIYYPAVVLSFLLCFRTSNCMERYNDGQRTVFDMERCLREVGFEVMMRLKIDEDENDLPGDQGTNPEALKDTLQLRQLRRRYFKHEFRRMVRLLFACAARDLNDSALEDNELDEAEASALHCAMTKVEHAAVLVTHSAFGHAFRVYLVSSWLLKLVKGVDDEGHFDGDQQDVYRKCEAKLADFKVAWLEARQVAYSSMPGSVTHILWLLTTVMCLFMPWEWVTICQWSTWFPSVLLAVSFYGILEIANSMENPFGFDVDDIPISQVAEHLDEEVCLTMEYAALDEFGGENLYRSLMGTSMIFLDEAGLPGSEGLGFLAEVQRAQQNALTGTGGGSTTRRTL